MKQRSVLEQAIRRVFVDSDVFDMNPVYADGDLRTWAIAHSGGRFIAKFPEEFGGLTIGPAFEFTLQQRAAAAGLSPRPLGHDVQTGIIFVDELTGAGPLPERAVGNPEILSDFSEMIQKLHALEAPQFLRRFDPPIFAAHYCEGLSGDAAHEARTLRDECIDLASRCEHLYAGSSICHNDLHAGNILVGRSLYLIDFEYAVLAAPIVDIASYAAFNNLEAEATMLLAHAAQKGTLEFSVAEFQTLIQIQRILGRLWEIARNDNNAPSGIGSG